MKKSGEVMAVMNKLVKLPELQKTMMNMQREMERAGLVDEMIQDSMDMMDGDDLVDLDGRVVLDVVAVHHVHAVLDHLVDEARALHLALHVHHRLLELRQLHELVHDGHDLARLLH